MLPTVIVSAQDFGSPFDSVFDNSGPNNQVLYQGDTYPGKANDGATPLWRIRKFFFDSNDLVKGWRWAGGSTSFDKLWTDRASYTYEAL